jgi:hypothetical protein
MVTICGGATGSVAVLFGEHDAIQASVFDFWHHAVSMFSDTQQNA